MKGSIGFSANKEGAKSQLLMRGGGVWEPNPDVSQLAREELDVYRVRCTHVRLAQERGWL